MVKLPNRPDLRSPQFLCNIATDSFREGRRYVPELAAFRGDPEAVVGSKSEAKALLERRGWECHGTVETEGRPEPPPEKYEVADSVVNREIADLNDKHFEGRMGETTKKKLFEDLKAKRSGSQE